jgi:hypothetical protein
VFNEAIKIRIGFRHKAAKKEVFIITDADLPTSKSWITAMSSQFRCKNNVLGYEYIIQFISE